MTPDTTKAAAKPPEEMTNPELVEALATEVMGWEKRDSPPESLQEVKLRTYFWFDNGQCCYNDKMEILGSLREMLFSFRPTEDWNDTMAVVMKAHDTQPRFILEAQPFVRPRFWICEMYGIKVMNKNPQRAICLAALHVARSTKQP